jgi:hypothetical protein
MNALQIALLTGLLGVAGVHTRSRVAGALAACLWCVGAVFFGVLGFETAASLTFLGIVAPPWLYFGSIAGLFSFNALVIVRALRRRRRSTAPER